MSESARRMLCTWWRLVASGANRQQLAHQYAGVLIRQSSCDVTVATSISLMQSQTSHNLRPFTISDLSGTPLIISGAGAERSEQECLYDKARVIAVLRATAARSGTYARPHSPTPTTPKSVNGVC